MYRPGLGRTPNYVAQSAQLTEARSSSWLGEGSQTVQQQALRDLDQAYRNWWSNPGHFRRPTWRQRGVHEGFRIVGQQATRWERLSKNRARVRVPKVGWVDWRWSRDPGDPKSYRVSQDRAGRWWISFAVIPPSIGGPSNDSVVGVDRGVTHSFVTSDGAMIDTPRLTTGERSRLLRLQRKLARQQKGSNRREATKRQIARIKHREVNQRKDTIEKLTTDLARTHDNIVLEDLNIGAMTASTKGAVSRPGVNVAAKSGLNREILSSGWGLFQRRLKDKIGDQRLVLVPAAYTSQRCNACGHTSPENRKSQAVFKCRSCGHSANADVNAAQNIRDLAAGCAVTARGAPSVGAVKREPSAA